MCTGTIVLYNTTDQLFRKKKEKEKREVRREKVMYSPVRRNHVILGRASMCVNVRRCETVRASSENLDYDVGKMRRSW